MTQTTNNLAADSWALADLLRGDFKQSQYGRIILPFNLLRRLECVLEESKDALLARYEEVKAMNVPEEAQEKLLLRATDGLTFFNTSKMDLSNLAKPVSRPIWNPIFRHSPKTPEKFSNTLNSASLLASLATPTCCIK